MKTGLTTQKCPTSLGLVPRIARIGAPHRRNQWPTSSEYAQWLFIYDEKNLYATIEDVEWLVDFQERKIDVRPGDALKCKVRIEVAYGHNNNVISKKHFIEKVLKVIDGGIKKSYQIEMYNSQDEND